MNQKSRVFRKSSLAIGVATVLSAASAISVQAVEWSKGDWAVNFDSQFSIGTSIRVEDRDFNLVGNSNQLNLDYTGYNPVTNPLFSASQVFANTIGTNSTNVDLGTLNYDSGEAFSTLFKGTHELDISYKNVGVFVRGFYFYDFELEDSDRDFANRITGEVQDPCGTAQSQAFLCSDIRFLDAFFYADFYIGDKPVSFRIGDQVISWGESTFIQHGINTSNPVNVSLARAPGARLSEIFIPVGTVFGSIELTNNFSISGYYQYQWEDSILPVSGSYFSTNDFVGEGGQDANIQLGFGSNPDIDLDFLLANLNGLGDALRAGGDPAQLGQAYLAYPTRVALRGFSDNAVNDADDQGQYGLKFTYFSEALNNTEFSLYYINYHSKIPLLSGFASNFSGPAIQRDLVRLANSEITFENVTDLEAFTEVQLNFPEDISLYGFSFNTSIGETALAGEIAFREDEPLQIDDIELLYAAFPQQLAAAGLRPDLAGISQLNNLLGGPVEPGGEAPGFVESDTVQAQFTLSRVLGPKFGADNFIVLGEFGYVDILDFPDPDFLRLNGPGTGRSGPIQPITLADGTVNSREGLQLALSNGPETNPFPTDDAWGYRLLARAEFNNVFSGANLTTNLTFSHDVDGITPDPLFLFIEDRKSLNLTFSIDYLNKWTFSASYNTFWDGVGTTNQLSDRDFISFVVNYAI